METFDFIVGKADIYQEDDGTYLANFEIYPKYRGRKFAHRIIEKLITSHGINTLIVRQDNKIAISLYKKHGFVIEKAYYAEDLQADVYYMKRK